MQADELEADSSPKARETSTVGFPYLDLDDAIDVAKAVFEKSGGECTIDQLAAYLSHDTVNSGAFRQKIATARMFGLIETGKDSVRLSDLGFEIVEPAREKAATVEAFLNVPLYKATFDRFRGRQLPPDGALERVFVEIGVARKQTAKARQVFQRSAERAGFFGSGRDRLVEPSVRVSNKDLSPSASSVGIAVAQLDRQQVEVPELVSAMFKQLPPQGTAFPKDRRTKWLMTLENVLDLVYGNEDY